MGTRIPFTCPDGKTGEGYLANAGKANAPGVVVIRLAAPLFFANGSVFADAAKKAVTRADAAGNGPVRDLVIDMEAVTDIDVTGAESLETLLSWLDAQQIELSFSRVRPEARRRLVELELLGGRRTFDTNRDAIASLVKGEA